MELIPWHTGSFTWPQTPSEFKPTPPPPICSANHIIVELVILLLVGTNLAHAVALHKYTV